MLGVWRADCVKSTSAVINIKRNWKISFNIVSVIKSDSSVRKFCLRLPVDCKRSIGSYNCTCQ